MEQQLINKSIPDVKSAIKDSTEIWKNTLDYMLTRIKERYSTVGEMEDDINSKFKEAMQVTQGNFDRWFEKELKQNLPSYGIEILGDDTDMVIEDGAGGNGDVVDENATFGEGNDEGGEDMEGMFDEEQPQEPNTEEEQLM